MKKIDSATMNSLFRLSSNIEFQASRLFDTTSVQQILPTVTFVQSQERGFCMITLQHRIEIYQNWNWTVLIRLSKFSNHRP